MYILCVYVGDHEYEIESCFWDKYGLRGYTYCVEWDRIIMCVRTIAYDDDDDDDDDDSDADDIE